MKKLKKLIFVFMVLSLVLVACAQTAPTEEEAAQTEEGAATEEAEEITLVDFGYTGNIQTDLFGAYMAEPFMEANPNVTVELIGGVSEDAIAQIKAAQGKSPIDTMLLGKPRYLQAAEEGWILEIGNEDDIPNVVDVYPNIQEQCSPGAVAWTVEIIGLIYNPDLVPEPQSWEDLWNPEYEGLVGVVSPSSNAGFLFYSMLANTYGSGEDDLDALWAKLDELEPFVVANNPEALSQLLENEEIGVAINWNTEAAVSLTKGYNVEFTLPAPGGIGQVGCYGVLKDTAYPEVAKAYVNTALGEDFQTVMSQAPFYFAPVNKNVELTEDAAKILPSADQYSSLITIDYGLALPIREQLTDEFIRRYGQ
ncbi:MAG: extracellular solute-binding protein [Chloroflexota bacterium]|nr:extracellular solute-binding protein [Chloroflexota bacterium]